jgi:hypothetical protein
MGSTYPPLGLPISVLNTPSPEDFAALSIRDNEAGIGALTEKNLKGEHALAIADGHGHGTSLKPINVLIKEIEAVRPKMNVHRVCFTFSHNMNACADSRVVEAIREDRELLEVAL